MIIFFFITITAYLLKGITGFGPAIVIVSLGSHIFPSKDIVVISAFLDVAGGLILFRYDRCLRHLRYWVPLSLAVIAGVAGGTYLLAIAQSFLYRSILSFVIAGLGFLFFFGVLRSDKSGLIPEIPDRPDGLAYLFVTIAGVCGALFGISGPPLIWYFGSRFKKTAFRKIIVPIFLMEAISRSFFYWETGLTSYQQVQVSILVLPALIAGLFLGNRIHIRINEIWFGRTIGVILILSGIWHYFK